MTNYDWEKTFHILLLLVGPCG